MYIYVDDNDINNVLSLLKDYNISVYNNSIETYIAGQVSDAYDGFRYTYKCDYNSWIYNTVYKEVLRKCMNGDLSEKDSYVESSNLFYKYTNNTVEKCLFDDIFQNRSYIFMIDYLKSQGYFSRRLNVKYNNTDGSVLCRSILLFFDKDVNYLCDGQDYYIDDVKKLLNSNKVSVVDLGFFIDNSDNTCSMMCPVSYLFSGVSIIRGYLTEYC